MGKNLILKKMFKEKLNFSWFVKQELGDIAGKTSSNVAVGKRFKSSFSKLKTIKIFELLILIWIDVSQCFAIKSGPICHIQWI